MGKSKVKREPIPVPQNLDEASDFLRRIGAARRAIDAAELKLNGEIERIKAKAVGEIEPHAREAEELILGLFVFADGRRTELTYGGKHKTVQLPAGELKWRTAPPAVSVTNVAAVIERLKGLGLDRFLRIPPPEIDKEAILKEPKAVEGVKGLKIGQKEFFAVKPSEAAVEIEFATAELKKKAAA